jgi:hypothetical protein
MEGSKRKAAIFSPVKPQSAAGSLKPTPAWAEMSIKPNAGRTPQLIDIHAPLAIKPNPVIPQIKPKGAVQNQMLLSQAPVAVAVSMCDGS